MKFFVRRIFSQQRTTPWGDPLPEYEFEVRRRFLFWSYVVDQDFSEEAANALAARLNGT